MYNCFEMYNICHVVRNEMLLYGTISRDVITICSSLFSKDSHIT